MKVRVNFLFFGFFFLFVASVHLSHNFLIDSPSNPSTYLGATCALLQTALETLVLACIAYAIELKWPRLISTYMLLVFLLSLCHLIDFPLERFMDMSIWYSLKHIVFQESWSNFLELLMASNISLTVWLISLLCITGALLGGFLFYKATKRYTIDLKARSVALSLGCLALLFGAADYTLTSYYPSAKLERLHKALPWKNTLFSKPPVTLSLPALLKDNSAQKNINDLDPTHLHSLHKPDIYIVIAESLRSDFITQETTPHLFDFKTQNISFPLTFSNANATHLSWFSLFHSSYPFHWKNPHNTSHFEGSPPLSLLKKMGYEIHVFSPAKLNFFQMNRVLFGEGQALTDSFFVSDIECDEPYMKDESAMDELIHKMQEPKSGRVFILFLDSTHFDYSFPKDKGKFTPYDDKLNYAKILFSKTVPDSLINRYKNSLNFVDSLFHKLLTALDLSPQGKESIVVFTGDHGEELFEQGNLFHASMLSKEQITPPIFYRFGNTPSKPSCPTSCHMDIFPSIFHYLTADETLSSLFEGQSIFQKNRWPYTLIARFNGSNVPTQYCVHNQNLKLTLEFDDYQNLLQSQQVRILSTKTLQDTTIPLQGPSFDEEFGPALSHLFPSR